jgi:hypothetical protein
MKSRAVYRRLSRKCALHVASWASFAGIEPKLSIPFSWPPRESQVVPNLADFGHILGTNENVSCKLLKIDGSIWCPEGDLNPHTHLRAADFKSAASADFAIRAVCFFSNLRMSGGHFSRNGCLGKSGVPFQAPDSQS